MTIASETPLNPKRFQKWRVFSASVFIMMLDYGFLYALGTMFVPMLDKFGENRGKTATIQSIFNGVAFIASTLTGLFVAKWGVGRGILVSSILIPLGFFVSFFAKSVIHLYVSLGILGGIGNSFIFVSLVVAVGQIFPESQRSVALSVLMTCMGVASIIYPYFLDWLLDMYGLNGTFLLLSGLYLNTFVTAIAFHYEIGMKPSAVTSTSKRHEHSTETSDRNATSVEGTASDTDKDTEIKRDTCERYRDTNLSKKSIDSIVTRKHIADNVVFVKVDTDIPGKTECIYDKTGIKTDTGKFNKDKDIHHVISSANEGEIDDDINVKIETHSSHVHEVDKTINVSAEADILDNDYINVHKQPYATDVDEFDNCLTDVPKIDDCIKLQQENCSGNVRKAERDLDVQTETYSTDVRKLSGSIKVHQGLCSVTFCLFAVASAMLIGNVTGFVTIAQDIYTSKGLSKAESLSGFLTFNICNTLSRLGPAVASKLKANCFTIPLIASIMGLTGQILVLFTRSFVPLMVGSGLSGAALGGYASAVVTATFELLGGRQQAVGFGIIVTVNGICVTCMGPVLGAMRDASGDYTYVLITTSTLNALCSMLIVCVFITVHLHKRRTGRNVK